jgi:hypothetical protein
MQTSEGEEAMSDKKAGRGREDRDHEQQKDERRRVNSRDQYGYEEEDWMYIREDDEEERRRQEEESWRTYLEDQDRDYLDLEEEEDNY